MTRELPFTTLGFDDDIVIPAKTWDRAQTSPIYFAYDGRIIVALWCKGDDGRELYLATYNNPYNTPLNALVRVRPTHLTRLDSRPYYIESDPLTALCAVRAAFAAHSQKRARK